MRRADHFDVLRYRGPDVLYQDHEPPHFHAEHQGQPAKFDLHGKVIVGNIRSKTALRLIQQWAVLHRADLEANWARMRAGQTLERIAPLEWGLVMMMPSVVSAEYEGGHRIRLSFSEGTVKTVDFRKWLEGPVFEPLKDPSYFRRFFLEAGTVVWPNGADIAPETLYEARGVRTRLSNRMQERTSGAARKRSTARR